MSYKRKRVFLLYSAASFSGFYTLFVTGLVRVLVCVCVCLCAAALVYPSQAYAQQQSPQTEASQKISPPESTSSKAVSAEIEKDINNSDPDRKQDAEIPYFFGSLPALEGSSCESYQKLSKGQTSEIAHLFSLGENHPCNMSLLAISKDGAVLGVQAAGGLLRVGELARPARVAAFHSDSGRLAVYDGESLKLIDSLGKIKSLSRLKAKPYSIQFSPDGESLLIGAADSRLYRWRFVDHEKAEENKGKDLAFERYIGHSTVVSAAAFHPTGRVVFSGDWAGGLNVWLLYDADRFKGAYDENDFWGRGFIEEAQRKKVSRSGNDSIEHLVLSKDGEFMFLGLKSGTIEGWQIRGMKRAGQIKAHKGLIYDMAVNDDGSILVSAGRDGIVRKISFLKEKSSNSVKFSYKELGRMQHDWIREIEKTGKGVFSGAGLKGKIGVLNFKKETTE